MSGSPESRQPFLAGLLAAGRSTRLGQDKALVSFCGESLLLRSVRLLLRTRCEELVVVCRSESKPSYEKAIREACPESDVSYRFRVPEGESLSDSLRALYACSKGRPVLVHQVDRPFVPLSHLNALQCAYTLSGLSQFSEWEGGIVPPALLAPGLERFLAALVGDQGAARLVRMKLIEAGFVRPESSDEGEMLPHFAQDVDTQEDLVCLQEIEATVSSVLVRK